MNNFSMIPGNFAESMTTILWVGGVFANIWKVINDKVTFTSLEHVHWALWLLRFIKLYITTICHFFRNMRASHLFFKKTLQIIEFGLLSTFFYLANIGKIAEWYYSLHFFHTKKITIILSNVILEHLLEFELRLGKW